MKHSIVHIYRDSKTGKIISQNTANRKNRRLGNARRFTGRRRSVKSS
jgi:hypothetical protein